MNLFFLTLVKAQQYYVILGGSGAANYNNYTYNATNPDVYSYYNGWTLAESPMKGGDGDGGSPWAQLGNNLNIETNEKIYFVDCARIGANITD